MRIFLLALLFVTSAFAETKVITLTKDNHINFNASVSGRYVAEKQLEVLKLVATSKAEEFYIVINSPGGSITAGNAFIETVKSTGKTFHTITLFGASMAYNIAQNLGKRYITPSGIMMSHRAKLSGLAGQIPGELNSQLHLYEKMANDLHERAAKRVGISPKLYLKQIYDELWLFGGEAVKTNHADQEVLVKCDVSLNGTVSGKVATFFGMVEVIFSECPIITAPVGVIGNSDVQTEVIELFNKPYILREIKTTL